MNSLAAYIRKVWLPEVQQLTQTALVGKQICDFVVVTDGNEFHKPYHSDLSVGDYTRNATSSAVAQTDVTTTDEYLTLATSKYTSFYIDKLDKIQMFYQSLDGDMKTRAAYQLAKSIDTAILAEYANASQVVDNGDVGGSAGEAITLTTTDGATGNILDVVQAAKSKLALNDIEMNSDLYMIVDSKYYYKTMERYLMAHGYHMADEALANGYVGSISGLKVYISNNLPTSTVSGATARHWLLGKKGGISLAIQSDASLDIIENPMNTDGTHRLGTQYVVSNLFGKKTFFWNAKKLIDIQVVA